MEFLFVLGVVAVGAFVIFGLSKKKTPTSGTSGGTGSGLTTPDGDGPTDRLPR